MGEQSNRALWRILAFAIFLLLVGTIGFVQAAHISFGDAFFQTLVILLGHYDPYVSQDPGSRVLVVILIISSLAVVAYLLKWFAEYMINFGNTVGKKRLKMRIDHLNNHYIICGLGRVGSQVASELTHEAVPFVALDRDQAKVDEATKAGYLAICLDSTVEGTLQTVGIERAKGLIAALGEDSLNLFITLAARSLKDDLMIVARANKQENEIKLKRAGADRVALPYQIGGYHMANMALRPSVVDYMDIVTNGADEGDLVVEEMVVGDHSKLAGHRLGNELADGRGRVTVIAINGIDGTSTMRPSGREMVYPGDRLLLVGARNDLNLASSSIR